MGRQYTYLVTLQDEHKLVTSGPYAWVRHPGYVSFCIFTIGVALSLFGPGSYWAAAQCEKHIAGKVAGGFFIGYTSYVSVILLTRMQKEDKVMQKEFKGQWERWARQTPYKLIPFVF